MCITLEPARLSNTLIYAAEAQRNGETFHVIGYQNKVHSTKGPNAMLLPLPAEGSLGPENIVDTRSFKGILDAYDHAVERLAPKRRSRSLTKSVDSFGTDSLRGFQVFKSGSYTIALAEKPTMLRRAIEHVPENVRPEIPGSFLVTLNQLYPDWPIALCCFNGAEVEAPEPLLWYFKPRFNRVLFAPAIDAHNGQPPNAGDVVERDHKLAFASCRSTRPIDRQLVEDIQRLVPIEHQWMFMPSVVGAKIDYETGNGDFCLPVQAVLDERSPQYLDKVEVAPPPQALPSVYDRIVENFGL